MKNMNHLIDIVGQSHQHMPVLLSLLLGLIIIKPFDKSSGLYPERSRRIKKNPSLFFSDDEAVGDNVPITFMESIRR